MVVATPRRRTKSTIPRANPSPRALLSIPSRLRRAGLRRLTRIGSSVVDDTGKDSRGVREVADCWRGENAVIATRFRVAAPTRGQYHQRARLGMSSRWDDMSLAMHGHMTLSKTFRTGAGAETFLRLSTMVYARERVRSFDIFACSALDFRCRVAGCLPL